MKLIVGLGNPGPRYRGTVHNVGFDVVDEVAGRRGVSFEAAPADALMARLRDVDGGALLVKPLTFMNVSGDAVGALQRYFRIAGGGHAGRRRRRGAPGGPVAGAAERIGGGPQRPEVDHRVPGDGRVRTASGGSRDAAIRGATCPITCCRGSPGSCARRWPRPRPGRRRRRALPGGPDRGSDEAVQRGPEGRRRNGNGPSAERGTE